MSCFRCDGDGFVCNTCGETELNCECGIDGEDAEFDPIDCEDCGGTGE